MIGKTRTHLTETKTQTTQDRQSLLCQTQYNAFVADPAFTIVSLWA